jgi:hypothetical protein
MPMRASLSWTIPVTAKRLVGGCGRYRYNERTSFILVETDLEGLAVDYAVDVAGEVVQDLERQVTERLLEALDPLVGVRLGECNAQEFSNLLGFALWSWPGDVTVGGLGECIEKLDALAEIGVVDAGLESEAVLY